MVIKKRKRKKEPGESENRWGIELNLNTVYPPSGTGNNQTPRELIRDNHDAADAAACIHAPEPALQGGSSSGLLDHLSYETAGPDLLL